MSHDLVKTIETFQSEISYLRCEIDRLAAENFAMRERLDAIERKSMVAYGTSLLAACLKKYRANSGQHSHSEMNDVNARPDDLVKTAEGEGLDVGGFLRDTDMPAQCYTLLKQYPKVSINLIRNKDHMLVSCLKSF